MTHANSYPCILTRNSKLQIYVNISYQDTTVSCHHLNTSHLSGYNENIITKYSLHSPHYFKFPPKNALMHTTLFTKARISACLHVGIADY